MVYTEDETFKNVDSWWHLKTNSSDVHGNLVVGKQYSCTVYGFRFSLTSSYRNILKCEEVE